MGVDQGIQLSALLAVGAVLVIIAGIVGDIVDIVHRTDGQIAQFADCAVQRRNTYYLAAVIADGFHTLIGGVSGGAGCHEDQNVLIANHGLHIVTENHLGVGVVLRLNNVDGIVGIDALETASAQLLSKAGADDSRTVQTQNGIHRGIILEVGDQLLGDRLSLAETGLGEGNIDVIIDMAVVGSEMPTGNPKGYVSMSHRQIGNFNHNW